VTILFFLVYSEKHRNEHVMELKNKIKILGPKNVKKIES